MLSLTRPCNPFRGLTLFLLFAELSYHELRRECKKVGLPTDGKAVVLRQRLIESFQGNMTDGDDEKSVDGTNPRDESPPKSNSSVGQAIVDAMLCPITLALPIDPVTASDGRVYERAAVSKHIQSTLANLRSPITNLPTGSELNPNP